MANLFIQRVENLLSCYNKNVIKIELLRSEKKIKQRQASFRLHSEMMLECMSDMPNGKYNY